MSSWDEVALRYGTDKSSAFHAYMAAYQQVLEGRKIDKLLELGVAHGKSLFMWAELFPDALIVGVDNDPYCRQHQRFNIDVVIADITDPAKMAAVSQLYGPFDCIIDDCDHHIEPVKKAFDELWWRLNPGGCYLIEDLDGSDPEVQEFIERFNGRFIDCDDKVGYLKKPGIIVIEKP